MFSCHFTTAARILLVVVWAIFLAVALGIGGYWAAEKKGRSPSVWLVVVGGTVVTSYLVAGLCARQLAGSNAIFTDAGNVAAIAAVAAAPLAGIASGVGLVGWLAFRAPYRLSLSSPLRMYGGFGEVEAGEVLVTFERDALVVRRGEDVRRLPLREISAEVDGEYLAIHVADEASPLMLRGIGDEYADRERGVALVKLIARRLGG